MRRGSIVFLLTLALLLTNKLPAALSSPFSDPGPAVTAPPKTEVNEVKETIHGVEIVDSYRWLEDQNSPQTRSWIDAENAYTDSLLSRVPGREALKDKIAALLKIETMSPPQVRNQRYFFFRRQPDQDQSSLFVRKGLTGTDDLLINPLSLSPSHSITVGLNTISRDGSLIVYSLRQGGEDEIALHLFDVDARKDLPDQLPRARYGSVSFLLDKSAFYYSKVTQEGPRLYLHKVGSSTADDTEVFGKGYGPAAFVTGVVTEDGRYLVIIVSHGSAADKTEVYLQDLKNRGPITPVVNDVTAAFFPSVGGNKMYIRTNWNAPKWRVMEVELGNPSRDQWKEFLPQGEGVLTGLSLVGGKVAVSVTENVVSHVRLYDTNGKLLREIKPPTLGSLPGLGGTWSSNEGFYVFSSFHVPGTIYRYDVATGQQSVWFHSKVSFPTDRYEVKQVWYASKDGTKIPMFLAHAKGIKLDGSHPTLLTGYGGFNVNSTPGFSPVAATWMSNGGVYALANLRGGGEFGEVWHHAGMLDKKQNVFDDFIAAAEWLISNKYTSPRRLAITGTSNGGLLMGAMLTQRPDLFGAVICGYPLLDMLRYHKFLVASYWVPEYGSAEDPSQFKYIYTYSPYQHVKPGTRYPAVLFISGDSDTRVAPLHARKMTALMQAANASGKPILLHYDTQAGHSGGTPVTKQIDNTTDELNFLMWQLEMTPQQQGAPGHK